MTFAKQLCVVGAAVAQLSCMRPAGALQQSMSLLEQTWQNSRNPLLSYRDWSIKDFAVVHHRGEFFVFFSAFYQDAGEIRCHVVEVSTSDFKTFSAPILNFAGTESGWKGMCSPSVTSSGSTFVLTFNSWGDRAGKPNQLFTRTSTDLRNWSATAPLAANLTRGRRSIDAALAWDRGRYVLAWKEDQTPRMASGESLGGNFQVIGRGTPSFELADGGREVKYENYQMLLIDGKWRLLATDMKRGHLPFLFTMQGTGASVEDWLKWTDGRELKVPKEGFNTADRANAAVLADWRALDGRFYLFYAGTTPDTADDYAGRGWNRLGAARSTDLKTWNVPGSSSAR